AWVGVGRAHEARVDLAGEIDVVAVAAVAHEQAGVVLAQDRLAESFAGRAGSRLEKGHVRRQSLRCPALLRRADSSRLSSAGRLPQVWRVVIARHVSGPVSAADHGGHLVQLPLTRACGYDR